jgi:hypothetical protein
MRHVLVLVVVLAACWRGQPTSSTTTNAATEEQALVAAPAPPQSPPTPPPPGYVVAGCNTGCSGCSIGKSTNVHGVDMKTGKELFPHPNTGEGGGTSCSAHMPINSTVRLIAKSGDGLVLEKWRPFNADDYCPCAGTNQPVCDVTVTQEIAAKFTRVYCGAEWKRQGAAQIGH